MGWIHEGKEVFKDVQNIGASETGGGRRPGFEVETKMKVGEFEE